MIDAALIYLAYSVAVITLAILWFGVGTWLLQRRDTLRDAQAISDLIEHEAVERDHDLNMARHLRLVERDNVVHAEERFAARRAVAHYPGGGAA